MPTQRSNRARRTLIWSLGAFVAIQLLLTVLLEATPSELADTLFQQKRKLLETRRGQADPEALRVVMVGSSRVLYGFEANALSELRSGPVCQPVSAINFGLSGGGPFRSLVTVHRLVDARQQPDLLIVEVMPPWLAEGDYELQPGRFWADMLGARDMAVVDAYAGSQRAALWEDWLFSRCVPWLTQRRQLLTRLETNCLPPLERYPRFDARAGGYDARPKQPLSASFRAEAVAVMKSEYESTLQNFRFGKPQCAAFRELLTVCREQRIAVVLLYMPESPEFRDMYPEKVREQIEAWVAEQSREFSAPIIDARTWIARDDFHDTHHLFDSGAARFTHRLQAALSQELATLRPALIRPSLACNKLLNSRPAMADQSTTLRR